MTSSDIFRVYAIRHHTHTPDNKVYGAKPGPTGVLLSPDGPMLDPWTLLSGILLEK